MDGEWRNSTHGWNRTSRMPTLQRTGLPDHGSLPMDTDRCTAPTLIKMTAMHPNQLFGQGKLRNKNGTPHPSHTALIMYHLDGYIYFGLLAQHIQKWLHTFVHQALNGISSLYLYCYCTSAYFFSPLKCTHIKCTHTHTIKKTGAFILHVWCGHHPRGSSTFVRTTLACVQCNSNSLEL